MKYCPLISYRRESTHEMDCMGEECMFWSKEADNCIIAASLKYLFTPLTTTQMIMNDSTGRPEPDPHSSGYPFNYV